MSAPKIGVGFRSKNVRRVGWYVFSTPSYRKCTMASVAENNLPDKVDELLAEAVNKDTLVLASISDVPCFGGSLATFFSARWLRIYQERTATLFQQLSEHLSNLDEAAVKKDYFDTPEGIDILIKALEHSAKTRSDQKRDLIARILTGAASTDSGQSTFTPEEYLDLLSDLTEQELKLAKSMYETRPEDGTIYANWHRQILRELRINDADLRVMLDRIQARRLCQNLLTPDPNTSRVYRSPRFVKMMEFLRLQEQD